MAISSDLLIDQTAKVGLLSCHHWHIHISCAVSWSTLDLSLLDVGLGGSGLAGLVHFEAELSVFSILSK